LDPRRHVWFEVGNAIVSARTVADSFPLPGQEANYLVLLAGAAEQLLVLIEDGSHLEISR